MDSEAVAGMIFTLLLALIVGGFILVYPLSRRVAALLERRLEGNDAPPRNDAEIDALRQTVNELAAHVDRLADRQDFMEKLLSQKTEPRPLGPVAQQQR